MRVHVLLYEPGKENEGIHSLEFQGKTIVLMFEDKDDAERYCGLLEAQDFPCPSIELLDRDEIEKFCIDAGYQSRFVETGFIPKSAEDRLLLAPPESNLDVDNWINDNSEKDGANQLEDSMDTKSINDMRHRLEGLL